MFAPPGGQEAVSGERECGEIKLRAKPEKIRAEEILFLHLGIL
jgi:hypothetical protein